MRKRPVQLGGEYQLWIDRDLASPHFHQFRLDMPVKRSVDLHHIEALSQKFQRMLFPALHARRIENPIPVAIGPASRTDANLPPRFHGTLAKKYRLAG